MARIDSFLATARQEGHPAGRPWVTLSYAQSIDGSIAPRRDMPLGLSGPESMRLTHQLRASHQAILAGIGTILADDPRLTVRLAEGPDPQPVILDSHLRMPLEARLLQNPCRPWIATLEEADPRKTAQLEQGGARLILLPAGSDGRVSLPALMAQLLRLGIGSLMVEGGATVIGAFLTQKLVDWLVLTIAPVFVGGLHAIPEGAFPISSDLRAYPGVRELEYERMGEDLVVWGRLKSHPAEHS